MPPRALVLGLFGGAAAAWPEAPPGVPANVSMDISRNTAHIRWQHAPPSAGGRASHYVVKWQAKDEEAVQWYPEFVGVGDEHVHLGRLAPGAAYAVRIAAVNTQGRAWSSVVTFSRRRRPRSSSRS